MSTRSVEPIASPRHSVRAVAGAGACRTVLLALSPPGWSPSAVPAILVGIGILSLAFCSLTGCQVPAPDAEADVEEVASLYFERLGSGVSARIADTTEVVLRSAENWETFAAALRPAQPFPPVDFSQMDVLVVAVAVPSGGYAVEFESVVQTGGEIVATYRLVTPGPDCLTALGQTVPFQVVSVRKSEGAVRFVRTTENLSCTA